MKIKDFKTHRIIRSNPPHKARYSDYKPYLKLDFCGRCAYCNLKDTSITTPFEVDHFIPWKAFNTSRMDLNTDYQNLVYSCKKCNMAKGSQFQGDMSLDKPVNEQFYDPVVVDYNSIFYRNEFGAIASDDIKGKSQITDLKLYRPIHSLAWICEELAETADKLEGLMRKEKNDCIREKLKEAYDRINEKYRKTNQLFIAVYNDNLFELHSSQEKPLIEIGT